MRLNRCGVKRAGFTQLSHLGYKLILGINGTIAYLEPVVVDGLCRDMQEFRDPDTVVDSQTNKGIDTKVCVKQFILLQHNPLLWAKQSVEILDKAGIEMQENRIEAMVKLAQLLLSFADSG